MYSHNNEIYWKIFVCNFINLRKHYNLTKQEMAEKCGISVKMLDEIEKGNLPDELSVEIIIRLSNHFNIKPTSLFEVELNVR